MIYEPFDDEVLVASPIDPETTTWLREQDIPDVEFAEWSVFVQENTPVRGL